MARTTDPVAEKIEAGMRNPRILLGVAFVLLGLGPAVTLAALLWLSSGFRQIMMDLLGSQFGMAMLIMALGLFIIIHGAAGCIWLERKLSAWVQDRFGPNRVGWRGLLQAVADGVKFILKEDIVPGHVDKHVFVLAPALAFVIALIGFAVIPWAGEVHFPWMPEGQTVSTQVANLDIGLLYMLAVASLSVYGVVLAGWASNNKYAFYGGMRATAQMLSYEVPLGLGLLVVLLVAGTLRLEQVVQQQASSGVWNLFLHPIAFLLVIISAFAETNRAPFDLAEAEQELVAGYHTEYSAMKFGLFFLAEYAHMITNSALMVAVFCGGWHLWGFPGSDNTTWWAALLKFGIFWAKVGAFIVFYMMIRWTLPRFRFDQLMRMAWKGMVPVGMGLVVVQGALVAMGWHAWSTIAQIISCWIGNGIVFGAALLVAMRTRQPVTGRQESLPEVEVAAPHRMGVV